MFSVGRKSKYDDNVKPYLKEVKEWRKIGVTEEKIAERLGISVASLNEYKKKYPEFLEALKKGVELFCDDLRSELARQAFKHKLETVKVYSKTDEDGQVITYKEKTSKEVDGSIAACQILLKNLDPNWSDDPKNLDLRRQELELKKLLAEANNFDISFGGDAI